MKTHRILFLALIVSAAFAVSAQAGDRRKGNNNNQAAYKSGGSSGAQVHSGAPRRIQSEGLAQLQHDRSIQTNRFSQIQGQRRDGIAQLQGQHHNRTAQLGTGGRNRTVGNISPGHNHVFAQQSVGWNRNWDRRHDHWWNGHRCRWVNNSWFIFDIGFVPWFGWPYCDYYAYDSY